MNLEKYGDNITTLIDAVTGGLGNDEKTFLSQCDTLESVGLLQEDDALVGFARFKRGERYYISNEMVDFYTEMVGCLEPFEKAGEWEYLARANNLLGIVSMNRGNAPFAMDYYSKALSYCRQHNLNPLHTRSRHGWHLWYTTPVPCRYRYIARPSRGSVPILRWYWKAGDYCLW